MYKYFKIIFKVDKTPTSSSILSIAYGWVVRCKYIKIKYAIT